MKPRGKTYARCGLIAKNVEGPPPPPPPPPGLIRVKGSGSHLQSQNVRLDKNNGM